MKPERIRLSRAWGFNLQAFSRDLNGLYAINVARPSRWGNPFRVGRDGTAECCVELYRLRMSVGVSTLPDHRALRGHNLACWCHLWQCPACHRTSDVPGKAPWCGYDGNYMLRVPCHADVLLEVANA